MKKLLVITFVLSLFFIKSQAQDTWQTGYLTGSTGVNVGPGGINLISDLSINETGVANAGWNLIYISIYADVNTPDGDFGYFDQRGPVYQPTQGVLYPTLSYPDDALEINTPVSSLSYYTITFQYYAVYQDSSLNLHYDYINETVL